MESTHRGIRIYQIAVLWDAAARDEADSSKDGDDGDDEDFRASRITKPLHAAANAEAESSRDDNVQLQASRSTELFYLCAAASNEADQGRLMMRTWEPLQPTSLLLV